MIHMMPLPILIQMISIMTTMMTSGIMKTLRTIGRNTTNKLIDCFVQHNSWTKNVRSNEIIGVTILTNGR